MSSTGRPADVADHSPGPARENVISGSAGEQRHSPWSVGALAVLSLCSAIAVLVATASGLGVSPDGVAYLSLADEFRTTGSPYAVLAPSPTHYAPLWSLLVGAVAAVTATDDLLGIGRWLNALLAAAVAPLVFVAVRRSRSAPVWWCLLVAALAASLFGLFRLSVRALTEPLFVVLLLGVLVVTEVAIQRRSRLLLIGAAVIAALLVATRFAGVAALVPLLFAAMRCGRDRRQRLVDALAVAAITVIPTGLWSLGASGTTTESHLGADARAGLSEFVESIVEAGHALIATPSTSLLDPPFFLVGAIVLAAPFVAAVIASKPATAPVSRARTLRRVDALADSGLLVWVLFLGAYTLLISVQRWWIDREIIDRYWIPFVVVGLVVIARSVADLGALRGRRWRLAALVVVGALVVVNVAQVGALAATRFDRGVELNESRYQESDVFAALGASGVEVVLTDSVRLVELHLVVLGGADDVDVRAIGCRWSGESAVVELAASSTVPVAVVLAGACDRPETRAALLALDGSELLDDPDATVVVFDNV